jgi:hypothetical protein
MFLRRDVGQEESSFSIKEESIITSSIIEKEEFEEYSIEWDYLSKLIYYHTNKCGWNANNLRYKSSLS